MDISINAPFPKEFLSIERDTAASGFTMASEPFTGSLLRSLAAAKPGGKLLELGTGTGLSTSWILDGMDDNATLLSVDHDEKFMAIARRHLGADRRLTLAVADGGEWFSENQDQKFDFVFADTWHGKYLLLDEGLSLLNPGGLYIIDDMLPQPNWPEGHAEKADKLIAALDQRTDFHITKLAWATGVVIATKKGK